MNCYLGCALVNLKWIATFFQQEALAFSLKPKIYEMFLIAFSNNDDKTLENLYLYLINSFDNVTCTYIFLIQSNVFPKFNHNTWSYRPSHLTNSTVHTGTEGKKCHLNLKCFLLNTRGDNFWIYAPVCIGRQQSKFYPMLVLPHNRRVWRVLNAHCDCSVTLIGFCSITQNRSSR